MLFEMYTAIVQAQRTAYTALGLVENNADDVDDLEHWTLYLANM